MTQHFMVMTVPNTVCLRQRKSSYDPDMNLHRKTDTGIPISYLPEKLVGHDPTMCLQMVGRNM